MKYRSLLVTDGDPPVVTLSGSLLPDNASYEIGGVPVFAGPAPWRANHDLLMSPEDRTLCGIVYPVSRAERTAVFRLCDNFPNRIVRYCVSPGFAAKLLRADAPDLGAVPRDWGDPAAGVREFPASLQPFRQQLRACLLGELDRSELPPEVREASAAYFDSFNEEDYALAWPGGDVDRVEVIWAMQRSMAELPSYFPTLLRVEIAQQFAEDIWFYSRDGSGIVGVGFNHIDEVLAGFDMKLPASIEGRWT